MGTVHPEPPRNHPHHETTSHSMGMHSAGVSATHDGDVERASATGRCAVDVAVVPIAANVPFVPFVPFAPFVPFSGRSAQGPAGGTPSAGSWAFSRSAMSSRLTRFSRGTSASGNHLASSLEPPTSLRSSPPVTDAR